MSWIEIFQLVAPFLSGIVGVWTGKKLTEFRLESLEKRMDRMEGIFLK